MADKLPRPLASGLMPGDVKWLETLVTELLADGETRRTPQAQRILTLLQYHEGDFRLDAADREQKLKDQWAAWDREASMRHCIVCSEIGWTQDLSGRSHSICMGCGRPLCLMHLVVHKVLEGDKAATPEAHRQWVEEQYRGKYGRAYPEHPTLIERSEGGLQINLPVFSGMRDKYTIFPDEYEQHWKHRCRTPIPHKDMNVLRAEQGILMQALVDIDKEMESAKEVDDDQVR